ncbi:DNA modification methylase [Methanohalophilus levihalophilus]|uniref:site-specific DNA-methyltransferase n=1 Tax=Methanohalophilus levihalophilus TaxID=1431282 RepID=UPI001AE6F7D7|nr:site-specific DNA-methyltransferase [Methanohalophilus levihalophilus]MBP2030335.1 DNA modification methylase [Methanohalophilus levihalophilus]
MQVITIPVGELKPFADNPKRHPENQMLALKKSLSEFGWTNPILVTADKMVVAGHARLQAALELGFTEVPVITLDLPYEKAVAYVIADNRLAELAETDTETLAKLLQEIAEIPDFDFEAIGYTLDDVDGLLESITPVEFTEDEPPEVPEEAVTVLGDIWELGTHKLLCGDSTDPEQVAKLMGEDRADLVFTDPPWNVNYGATKHPSWKQRSILNDAMGTEDFKEFMMASFSCMNQFSKDGCPTYVVMSAQEWGNMMLSLKENNYHWSSTIIWAKDRLVLSRKDYHTQYEPIWYGWKDGAPRLCQVEDRKQSDLWEFERPSASELHPTTKPVALVANAISNSTRQKGIVLDLFGGSGTTLIASHQLNRVCYGVELDPRYCDVIVQRYVNLTGNHELKRNGEDFTWEEKREAK